MVRYNIFEILRTLRGENVFDNIENLKINFTKQGPNKKRYSVENRKAHAFLIRTKGAIEYDLGDKTCVINEGEIVFVPRGASYTATLLADEGIYTSINFDADFAETPPLSVFSLENFYEAEQLTYHFPDMWNMGTPAERHKCLSLLYDLFSYICTLEDASYSEKKKFRIIDPAVNYLKEQLYNPTLKTDKLHTLCGVSDTYFRQIFVSRFGMTPQKFIVSKRLSHARNEILSGDSNSITEVALNVGFNDPLYFSKVFKKAYGLSPSELRKN